MSEPTPTSSRSERIWWIALLAATVINCSFQIAWFWQFRAHNIMLDGINYIGLSRHLLDGDFKASVHGYWSPLISWIIAAASLFSRNFILLGRLVTISSFLVSLLMLYVLTLRLWRSRVAAALAILWFSTARGMVSLSVGMIVADFILTACVLAYFIFLVDALRENRPRTWILLGAAQALAFLAKAIAMPWLSISTVLAVLVQNARSPRRLVGSMLLAFLLPAVVWVSWGAALRTKYGVFTTGYQLRANLMIDWRRTLSHHPRGDDLAFADTRSLYDSYMVTEHPWSELQSFTFRNPQLLPMVFENELRNVPTALKEGLILLSPGGVLALVAMATLLIQNRLRYRAEAAFTSIALLNAVVLVAAYCMLVFDGRYVIPIVPVLIAVSCPVLLPGRLAGSAPQAAGWLRTTALGLVAASTIFFALYWASPFRTIDRDFEVSCYRAADLLRAQKPGGTLVSIGDGPYPDHGVGFEAGSYVAYLSGWRLVGGNAALPDSSGADELVQQVLASRADAVAVWGSPGDPNYGSIVERIEQGVGSSSANTIPDPRKGEVATLIVLRKGN